MWLRMTLGVCVAEGVGCLSGLLGLFARVAGVVPRISSHGEAAAVERVAEDVPRRVCRVRWAVELGISLGVCVVGEIAFVRSVGCGGSVLLVGFAVRVRTCG